MRIQPYCAAILALCLSPTVAASEPSFGFGVTYVFKGETAIGLRVFSTDERDRGALALGLDYAFKSKSLRPTIGAAYLGQDMYVDVSVGMNMTTQSADFGIGIGGLMGMASRQGGGGGGGGAPVGGGGGSGGGGTDTSGAVVAKF